MHEFVVFCCGSDLHLHQLGRVCGRGENIYDMMVRNVCFKLALKQGFSALVTVISLIYSAVCVAGSCLDLQQPAVEAQRFSSTGFSLVFLRRNADLASFARAKSEIAEKPSRVGTE